MSQYYTSGDILAQKNPAKTEEHKDLAGEYLAEKGYERKVKPREINGGRDRLPENYTKQNKERLNDALAATPIQAKRAEPKRVEKSSKPARKRIALKKPQRAKVVISEVRKEKHATPFPISMIFCVVALTVISLYVVHLYIELDQLNSALTTYNNSVAEMRAEERVLQSQKASKYDLEEIEKIAKEKYGMVDRDQVSKEYITPEIEDSIEIMETAPEEETAGALLSGFAGVVSEMLSYIN